MPQGADEIPACREFTGSQADRRDNTAGGTGKSGSRYSITAPMEFPLAYNRQPIAQALDHNFANYMSPYV